jgi:hypothetical protein
VKRGVQWGGWGVDVRKFWAHHPPSQPMIAAQLLGEPATGEPYTILITGKGYQTFSVILQETGLKDSLEDSLEDSLDIIQHSDEQRQIPSSRRRRPTSKNSRRPSSKKRRERPSKLSRRPDHIPNSGDFKMDSKTPRALKRKIKRHFQTHICKRLQSLGSGDYCQTSFECRCGEYSKPTYLRTRGCVIVNKMFRSNFTGMIIIVHGSILAPSSNKRAALVGGHG